MAEFVEIRAVGGIEASAALVRLPGVVISDSFTALVVIGEEHRTGNLLWDCGMKGVAKRLTALRQGGEPNEAECNGVRFHGLLAMAGRGRTDPDVRGGIVGFDGFGNPLADVDDRVDGISARGGGPMRFSVRSFRSADHGHPSGRDRGSAQWRGSNWFTIHPERDVPCLIRPERAGAPVQNGGDEIHGIAFHRKSRHGAEVGDDQIGEFRGRSDGQGRGDRQAVGSPANVEGVGSGGHPVAAVVGTEDVEFVGSQREADLMGLTRRDSDLGKAFELFHRHGHGRFNRSGGKIKLERFPPRPGTRY